MTFTVACVKWGDKYPPEYVLKLQSMCRRNLPPHRFVCLTENPVEGVECRPLPSDLPTWWSKVGLFKPGLFDGDVLYLDLDVIITARLDGLVSLLDKDRSRLWVPDDFSYSLRRPRTGIGADTLRQLGGVGCVNSSVMLWHGDAPWYPAWQAGADRYMRELHGDQNAITQILWPEQIELLPNESIQSYKYGIRMRGEKPAPIVVMHGEPKCHQLSEPWVTEHWKEPFTPRRRSTGTGIS